MSFKKSMSINVSWVKLDAIEGQMVNVSLAHRLYMGHLLTPVAIRVISNK